MDAKDGVVPATVAVTCNGVQAEYVPAQHMVACRCAQCGEGGKLLTCQQFEAHTGSRAKKWKETIRLAAVSGTRLSEWVRRCGLSPPVFPLISLIRPPFPTLSQRVSELVFCL